MHRPTGLGRLVLLSSAAGLAGLAACSGGGSSPAQGGFQLLSISVPDGSVWPINKRIELRFNDDVDLSSVIHGLTLQLKSVDGSGASAFYSVAYKSNLASGSTDKTTLVIQPFCPLLSDLSDAGLKPGGTKYELFIPGAGSSQSTIKSVDGAKLQLSQKSAFFTPTGSTASTVFADTAIGPPSLLPEGTFVRLGDGTEIPFVFTGTQHELPQDLPLNLYSDASSKVTYLVQVDQAVNPAASNLTDDKVRLEFLDGAGEWQAFRTQVELESNCDLEKPGALLRLTPIGILPQASHVRVKLVAGFTDIVGQGSPSDTADFVAPTEDIFFASLTPEDQAADEVFEDFLIPGGVPGSLQDTDASFDTPVATWVGGKLSAAFDFQGSGGPGGTFDWHVPLGTFTFSTDFQPITGGPGGVATTQVNVVNGVLDLNDFVVPAGSTLRILPGDHPLKIIATGDVIIEGTLDMSGYDAKPVGTLFTPNQPEPGSPGPGGGGTGGTGSFLTTASTPQGGPGDGPFGAQSAGGQGGETGYNPTTEKQLRRGAGGGGGRFGPDVGTAEGEAAQNGDPGHPEGFGALSAGAAPPQGGLAGDGPFLDGDDTNDFFGRQGVFDDLTGLLLSVTQGELGQALAGYGGGAGGDAIQNDSFPTIPFGPPYIDKKGAGGGGGGGQVEIVALGRIIFLPGGRLLSDGGGGNTGENVLGFDHIAGSSGGGSGGHIILQSATQIDFTNGGTTVVPEVFVQALGGVGGIPMSDTNEWSGGGNGGPGVIQLHVPDANPATAVGSLETSAIRVPALQGLEDLTNPPGQVLIPVFGARSKARSIWIPIGEAGAAPGGGADPVLFDFGGTVEDPLALDAGQVLTTDEVVDPLAPILGPETLGSAAPDPFVDTDGFTLVLSSDSLQPLITDAGTPSNDIYLRNPALLRSFTLRLTSVSNEQEFDVASAVYSDAGTVLRVLVSTAAASLESFVDSSGGPSNVSYELVPRFFRVQTGTTRDLLPDTGFVKVLFQATGAGIDGGPDEQNPLVDWTPDASELNAVPEGSLRFFRFEVEFNLDSAGAGLTVDTEPISLEFLRLPFSF